MIVLMYVCFGINFEKIYADNSFLLHIFNSRNEQINEGKMFKR